MPILLATIFARVRLSERQLAILTHIFTHEKYQIIFFLIFSAHMTHASLLLSVLDHRSSAWRSDHDCINATRAPHAKTPCAKNMHANIHKAKNLLVSQPRCAAFIFLCALLRLRCAPRAICLFVYDQFNNIFVSSL